LLLKKRLVGKKQDIEQGARKKETHPHPQKDGNRPFDQDCLQVVQVG
jgi:hypothetical protein